MACVTRGVRRKICWNRKPESAVYKSSVTPIATCLGFCVAFHVLVVIELNVEAFFESRWKVFQRWSIHLHFSVTDRTHRNGWRSELTEVTTLASAMSRKLRSR